MKDMAQIAKENNFEEQIELPNNMATLENVKTHITNYAVGSNKLKSKDILLITYAGHGDIRRSLGTEENDFQDESWCLYDRQLWDNELLELWTKFDEGVRILVISDSCNSGTILDFLKLGISNSLKISLEDQGFDFKDFEKQILRAKGFDFLEIDERISEKNRKILENNNLSETMKTSLKEPNRIEYVEPKIRNLPATLLDAVYEKNKSVCDEARIGVRTRLRNELINTNQRNFRQLVKASVLLISACQDNGETGDGHNMNENGVFTKALKKVWNNGNFQGNYLNFRDAIWNEVKVSQKPNYYPLGAYNADFENQRPFTI